MDLSHLFIEEELVDSLEKPRKIILMVKAGKPVDDMILLLPLLDKGDLLMDEATPLPRYYRKKQKLKAKEYIFLVQISSEKKEPWVILLYQGSREAYDIIENMLKDISAQVGSEPCFYYIGKDRLVILLR